MKYLATITFCLTLFASPLYSASNPVKGEELFKQCAACHTIGEGATHTVGPTLNHLFGRIAGTAEGYANYSAAMKAKGETDKQLWDEKSLYVFVAGPERYVPGTSMGFEGLRREQEIKDLLAFLIQFSPAYVPESGELVDATAASEAALPVLSAADEIEDPAFTEDYLAKADAIE